MLRIEDTDRTRYVPGCEEEIVESLVWMGIDWQEGPDKGGPHAPYKQSERQAKGIYDTWIKVLLETGHAYKAFETPEELTEMREFQQINKQATGYFGGVWRDATDHRVAEAEASGKPAVIRLAMPRDKKLVCHDAIRGRVEFESGSSDDPVLIKADGMPTYHFAAMVDDHLMETSHIIRGEEWISSAPKHVWLFEAFGWEPPIFVHVPVIKGKDGQKLSKRHGDTKCLDFRAAGYLPEALANFIALIGWAPGGDRELMSMNEMAEAFDLSGLQPSPGVFDADKLKWMNGHYIRNCSMPDLVSRVREFVFAPDTATYWSSQEEPKSFDQLGATIEVDLKYAEQAIGLEQERVQTLAEFGEATAFFFDADPKMDAKAAEKWLGESHVAEMFDHFIAALEVASEVTASTCEAMIRSFAEAKGFEKLGPVVHPTRVALTGKTAGPGLFDLMAVLGKERMISRFKRRRA